MTQTSPLHAGKVPAAPENGHAIRVARAEDLDCIVAVHKEAFVHSFLTQLGPEFLKRYYALVFGYPRGILLVQQSGARVVGFACGFVDPDGFYGLMRKSKITFIWPVLVAVVRCPALAGKVARGFQRVEKPVGGAASCELSSLAVRPDASRKGTGAALARAFVERARSLAAHHVYLHTDADENSGVNAFYCRAGFALKRRFARDGGRWMNEYVIDFPEDGRGA